MKKGKIVFLLVVLLCKVNILWAQGSGKDQVKKVLYQEDESVRINAQKNRLTTLYLIENEKITYCGLSDASYFEIDQTESVSETHPVSCVIIKPIKEFPPTDLLITTTQRSYHLIIENSLGSYDSIVRFQLSLENKLKNSVAVVEKPEEVSRDFIWKKSSDYFCPVDIYTQGHITWIEFSEAINNRRSPIIIKKDLKNKSLQLVNFQQIGTRYRVDELLDYFMIRLGEQEIEVEKKGVKKRFPRGAFPSV